MIQRHLLYTATEEVPQASSSKDWLRIICTLPVIIAAWILLYYPQAAGNNWMYLMFALTLSALAIIVLYGSEAEGTLKNPKLSSKFFIWGGINFILFFVFTIVHLSDQGNGSISWHQIISVFPHYFSLIAAFFFALLMHNIARRIKNKKQI